MEDIRLQTYTNYDIKDLGYAQIERGANHRFAYKNGKSLYSFIFVKSGAMTYRFPTLKKTIALEKDSVLYIPKLLPYETTYLQDGTKIKILTFDMEKNDDLANLNTPSLPTYPSQPSFFPQYPNKICTVRYFFPRRFTSCCTLSKQRTRQSLKSTAPSRLPLTNCNGNTLKTRKFPTTQGFAV